MSKSSPLIIVTAYVLQILKFSLQIVYISPPTSILPLKGLKPNKIEFQARNVSLADPPQPPTILGYEEGTPLRVGQLRTFNCVALGATRPQPSSGTEATGRYAIIPGGM
ncbi:hypothetical protein CEXT_660101 [Caerostris extrusa]|uniref:Uncharacterized protein n=1 Tax=Caerostris extrusa TaxID=172846 RepID=A0AAV4VDH1_CAEEX|nr:hypothetical protein CEXT_660101 [Caerostris extrusa]